MCKSSIHDANGICGHYPLLGLLDVVRKRVGRTSVAGPLPCTGPGCVPRAGRVPAGAPLAGVPCRRRACGAGRQRRATAARAVSGPTRRAVAPYGRWPFRGCAASVSTRVDYRRSPLLDVVHWRPEGGRAVVDVYGRRRVRRSLSVTHGCRSASSRRVRPGRSRDSRSGAVPGDIAQARDPPGSGMRAGCTHPVFWAALPGPAKPGTLWGTDHVAHRPRALGAGNGAADRCPRGSWAHGAVQ